VPRAWSATLVIVAATGCNAIFGVDDLGPGIVPASSTASSGSGGSATASTSEAQSSAAQGVGGAGGGSAIGGSGGVPTVGCSDETRELFDPAQDPDIAGCSGAWSVAGVQTAQSMVIHCNRQAGNDGTIPTGLGCSVEDLCSPGWHVCATSSEVFMHSSTGLCPTYLVPGLWITRQGQGEGTNQCAPASVNNLVGCGTFGDVAHATCAPLDRRLDFGSCDMTATWECGLALDQEGINVTKIGSDEGGVLCCRD
jgi:hypothetical protein